MRDNKLMDNKIKGGARWQRYNSEAKPKLDELISFCQKDGRVFPQEWPQIISQYSRYTSRTEFTKYPPLLPPLILAAAIASDEAKRLRFLTQIYWCYQNYFMGSCYSAIMKTNKDSWHFNDHPKPVTLTEIKKEYAGWLGVNTFL